MHRVGDSGARWAANNERVVDVLHISKTRITRQALRAGVFFYCESDFTPHRNTSAHVSCPQPF